MATVAFALAAAGCFGDDRPLVETAVVTDGEVVQTVAAPARVDAGARQDVVATVSGTVAAIEVADGEQVHADQPVVRLSSPQVDLARRQAAAAQAAAQPAAGVDVPSTGAATRAAAEQAAAELDATVAPQIAQARAEAAQLRDPQQREAAADAIAAIEAAYRATRAGILASGQALAAQQDAVAAALAEALGQVLAQAGAPQRAQAEAAAAAAAAGAEQLVATAPFTGTVTLGPPGGSTGGVAAGLDLPPGVAGLAGGLAGGVDDGGSGLRVGAPVVAGQVLFTVYDLSSIVVHADVDEIDAPQVRAGQEASVLVDALGDAPFDGLVEHVDLAAQATDTGGVGYTARIRLLPRADDDDAPALDTLRIGMTASVEIRTKTATSELVVPSRALVRRDGATAVYVVDGPRVRLVPVEVDALGEERAAVRGGLERRDRVVVAGYENLTDGDEVRTS